MKFISLHIRGVLASYSELQRDRVEQMGNQEMHKDGQANLHQESINADNSSLAMENTQESTLFHD